MGVIAAVAEIDAEIDVQLSKGEPPSGPSSMPGPDNGGSGSTRPGEPRRMDDQPRKRNEATGSDPD
jgi:hypothetical protein